MVVSGKLQNRYKMLKKKEPGCILLMYLFICPYFFPQSFYVGLCP